MFIVAALFAWLQGPAIAGQAGADAAKQAQSADAAKQAQSADAAKQAGELGTVDGPARFDDELTCLAQNIYFEARSEPAAGMLAVGHVVLNRVAARKFPDTICDVVRQGGERKRHRCQFSWWCDGRSDEPRNALAWDAARLIAWFVYQGQTIDPTDGALWYHAEYVEPYWRDAFLRGPQIGRHIFYSADS